MGRIKDHFKKSLFLVMIGGGLIGLAGCATVPTGVSRLYLKDICAKHAVAWQVDSVSQVVTLRKGDAKASALVGSDVVMIGRERVSLSQPIERQREAIIVPCDFESRVIEKILRVSPAATGRPLKVVIDPGHGGRDPGAIGRDGIREKDIVLDIAKRLRQKLSRRGIAVIMTRTRDEFVSLPQRTEIAARANADLFVSIHANADPSRRAEGIEIYACKELGYMEKRDEQRLKNYRLLLRELAMSRDSREVEQIIVDMVYDHKRVESPLLADSLAGNLARDLRGRNRGAKRSGFFVVRNTLMPAVLVEVGFLSHYREAKLLDTCPYRQKIADSLAESILQYARW